MYLKNWERLPTKFSGSPLWDGVMLLISESLTCYSNEIAETTHEKIVNVGCSIVHFSWAPVLHLHFQYPVKDSIGSSCHLWTNSGD